MPTVKNLKGIRPFQFLWLLLLLLPAGATAQPASQQIYFQCLTNFETYAESIWHASGTIPDSGYWGDGGSTGNGGIRGNSGIAVAYAALALAQPNDPKFTNRIARIRQALNYDFNTHTTGGYNTTSNNKWGWNGASGDWQTPEWSASMGLACVLMQSNLPAATILGVRKVLVSEADHRAAIAPASRHVSDTAAEENAWQGNVLALAAAWMSTSNNAPNWLLAAKKYLANTYTVSNTNGDALSAWLTTVTLFDDWALENHGFYHPTYEMVAGMSSGDSLLMAQMADPNIAAQLKPFAEHNVMAVWSNNLSGMVLDSGDFAYPAGLDWELHDYEQYSFITWMAAHFNDPVARWTDDRLAQVTRYRQQVNGDGRFVGTSGGGFYREAVEARRVAISWLHWTFADFPSGPVTAPAPLLQNLTDVAIITARGTNGFVTISYGPQTNGASARIMATIEPLAAGFPSNTIVTTPRLPGIIGIGAMGSPTRGRLVNLTTNGNSFFAELQVTNGANGTTEIYFYNTGDSIGIVEVPHPAPGVVNSLTGSFKTGIENDPLCGGARLLEWNGNSISITNRSGASKNITNNWVCVSGSYGVAFGPGGYVNYTAATSYNRLGAAEDTLAFLPTNSLAPRFAVYFPNKTALQTSNLAAQITWNVSGSNAVLSFPGAGGSPAQISAAVDQVVASLNYPPYLLDLAAVTASSSQSATYPATNAVDNSASTFWVSLYGPTNHAEWLKVVFPRPIALSEFQVAPRAINNGYGPTAIQMFANVTNAIPASGIPVSGSNFWSGPMAALATLDVKLSPPVYVTNAVLVMTGAYDNNNTNAPRNVQIVELNFFERALPGTFAAWQLQNFSDAQLTNSSFGVAAADPDGDGVANLLEFACGGNAFVADATSAAVSGMINGADQVAFRFQERNALGNVVRQFQTSEDLQTWANVTPLAVSSLQNLGAVSVLEAVFPLLASGEFFRLGYNVPN